MKEIDKKLMTCEHATICKISPGRISHDQLKYHMINEYMLDKVNEKRKLLNNI